MRSASTFTPALLLGGALLALTILLSACEEPEGVAPRHAGGCHAGTSAPTTADTTTTATRADSTGRLILPAGTSLADDVYGPSAYQRIVSALTAPGA